jgi:Tol biopolymer transport system component
VEGDGTSATPSISADGRYVAFSSESTNLVAGDTNLMADIFVYDRQTDTIERVSVDDAGVEGDGTSATPSISADGRYVAFGSESANLVAGDTNGVMDIFVYDRQTDTIERVSVDDAGVEGDLASQAQAISADGRYIALTSRATNLVAGDTNGVNDIFVYDRQTDTIERVSVSSLGVQGNAEAFFQVTISADGRYVGFVSNASNLVAGDTNFSGDTFIYDRNTDTIERASMNNQGVEGDATSIASVSISSTGRYITFASVATNLVAGDTNGVADIFLYDREYEIVESISESSPSNFSSGYITPHINIEGYATMTDSRIVELVVWSPISISNYVISNDPDFSHAEAYARETLEKHLYWDICKNSTQCAPGTKRIYVRFYNGANFIGEHFVDIDYSLKRECPYFKEYLRKGTKNIREEVIKAQEFLNRELGISLVVDGIFGQETDKAVRAFQEKYSTQIILPWAGLDHSTGWWYITTSAFANILVGC